ncbi:MAG TPA: hypothetical protein VI915_01950 [Thermoplasmata archaeon]|nr:hypothetical protein [Thermoplasmata archaeon]
MPLKFWKKEEKKPAPPPTRPAEKPKQAPAKPAAAAPPVPAAKPKRPAEEVAAEAHHGLVEAGITIEGTREVFKKRLAEKFGSLDGFVAEYERDPAKAVTGFIATWLGFSVPDRFTLADLLYNANQRLSSFGVQVSANDEVIVDEGQGRHEVTLSLSEEMTTFEFQTPRDVFAAINALVRDRGVRFLELETWSNGYAFMLAKTPHWSKLADGELVVVKAEETAGERECPECGSRVGEKWTSCIACNSPLG